MRLVRAGLSILKKGVKIDVRTKCNRLRKLNTLQFNNKNDVGQRTSILPRKLELAPGIRQYNA